MQKKSPENFEKSKTRKKIRQNSKNKIFAKNGTYVKEAPERYICTKFEEFILIYGAMNAKIQSDLLLAVKQVKVTRLQRNANSTCRATQQMYIPSLKLIPQSMLKKSPESCDGRTDGQTDGHRHNIIRPFFQNGRIKMKLRHSEVFPCHATPSSGHTTHSTADRKNIGIIGSIIYNKTLQFKQLIYMQ